MAGRPKKDATKVVAQIDVSNEVVQDVTQELLKKFEELQQQLTELKAENEALKNNELQDLGTPIFIKSLFGGKDQFKKVIRDIEEILYAA